MKILLIGANGQIGQKVLFSCQQQGLNVRAMVRTQEQQALYNSKGIEAVIGDLEGDFSHALSGCDTVIFSAGSGNKTSPHKTLTVDLWGGIRAIEESEKKGIKHFIMVSSLKANDPLRGPAPIRHYLVARNLADDRLVRSKLNYTLLRPGRLLDEPATGKLTHKFDWQDMKNATCTVTRDDVAQVIMHILSKPFSQKQTIDFINGEEPMELFLDSLKDTEAA